MFSKNVNSLIKKIVKNKEENTSEVEEKKKRYNK